MAVGNIEFAPPIPPEMDGPEKADFSYDLFYDVMVNDGLLSRVNLPAALQSSARDGIALSAQRIADYSLLPMRIPPRIPKVTQFGWAEGFGGSAGSRSVPQRCSDGRFYRIYLNAPLAIGLVYRGSPQAVVAFNIFEGTELFLRQIQGVRSSIEPYPLSKDDIRGSRGLALFRYPELMVRIVEEFAANVGMESVVIKPACKVVESDLNPDISFEAAQKNYDQPARALGYRLDSDQLWRKDLGATDSW